MECSYRRPPSSIPVLTKVMKNVLFKYLISSLYHSFKTTMRIENPTDRPFMLFEG